MSDYAKVLIQWIPAVAGGRSVEVPLRPSGAQRYMPHFRLGPRGDYLGVAFLDGTPPVVAPGQTSEATVALIYVDTGVDYSPLLPGVQFEVVEGARVVGRGAVLQRWQEDNDWRSRPAV
jgi:hypothetical protein